MCTIKKKSLILETGSFTFLIYSRLYLKVPDHILVVSALHTGVPQSSEALCYHLQLQSLILSADGLHVITQPGQDL